MKVCSVWYTLLSGTCWVSTLALSTATPTWGTPKRAVVMTPASSGRFWAAAMKIFVFLARKSVPLPDRSSRSEEHTSELQSLRHLVCRLLLEKKKTNHDCDSGYRGLGRAHSHRSCPICS